MREKQPGSKHCFVCGRENPLGLKMAFYRTGEGEVRAHFSVPADYQGYPGVVHGGIIAAILDETGGRALLENPTDFMVTAQLNVRYRKPVPILTPLVIVGQAGERRGRVSYAKSEIQNSDGDVLAEATLVLADIPKAQIPDVDPEVLGWRIYPDEEA